jgi:hypothetical protein
VLTPRSVSSSVDLPVLLPGVEQLVEAERERRDQLGVDAASWMRGHSKSVIDDVAAPSFSA